MALRFQRRIRIAPGGRLNLSKSGIGGSIGRNGLRLGIDVNRRKYFSIGWPGLACRAGPFGGGAATCTLDRPDLCLMVLDGQPAIRSKWAELGGKLWMGDISPHP